MAVWRLRKRLDNGGVRGTPHGAITLDDSEHTMLTSNDDVILRKIPAPPPVASSQI